MSVRTALFWNKARCIFSTQLPPLRRKRLCHSLRYNRNFFILNSSKVGSSQISVWIQNCTSSHTEDCSLPSVPEIFKSKKKKIFWFCTVDSVVNSWLLSWKSHTVSALFRDCGLRRIVVSYRRSGTAYLFHLPGLSIWPWQMEPIGCPETSILNYNSTLCKFPKERK